MREIKFRAWDNQNKAWITEPVGFTMSVVDGKFHVFGFDDAFADMYQIRVELQQYTGLKDKNGVEIYEGDIVQWHYGNNTEQRVVEWVVDQAMFLPNDMDKDPPVEVIGNIYEHSCCGCSLP